MSTSSGPGPVSRGWAGFGLIRRGWSRFGRKKDSTEAQISKGKEMSIHSEEDPTPPQPPQPPPPAPLPLSFGSKLARFFKKYFCEGQKLNDDQAKAIANLSPDAPLSERIMVKHRKFLGILIPFVFVHVIWWCLAIRWDFFRLFPHRYIMTITMCFGSTVAGATSEGGGSVAFPVMTLALGLPASVARDFSLMIQSFGMTAATFTIFFMKIKLEWYSIIYTNLGAIFGIIFGLEYVDHFLTPPVKKLGFASVWFAFAVSLGLLNRYKRRTFDTIPDFNAWKAVVLLVIGFIGGIISALCGVGVDICSFSVLCLLFRVSEKVATPTSIVLMAANTVTGFFWRQLMTETGCEPLAWEYLAVAIPVAVFFAPFGAFLSSHFHRQVFATFVYIVDTICLITAYIVLPMTWQLGLMSVCLIFGCFGIFYGLSRAGGKLMQLQERKEMSACNTSGNGDDCCSLKGQPQQNNNSNNSPMSLSRGGGGGGGKLNKGFAGDEEV